MDLFPDLNDIFQVKIVIEFIEVFVKIVVAAGNYT